MRNAFHNIYVLHYLDWQLGDALQNNITKLQKNTLNIVYVLNIKIDKYTKINSKCYFQIIYKETYTN